MDEAVLKRVRMPKRFYELIPSRFQLRFAARCSGSDQIDKIWRVLCHHRIGGQP